MKKIDLSKELVNFKGEALKIENNESLRLGSALSSIIIAKQDGDKLKNYSLAQRFFTEKGLIDLDDSDFALVKTAVENDKTFGIIVTGQILSIFSNL